MGKRFCGYVFSWKAQQLFIHFFLNGQSNVFSTSNQHYLAIDAVFCLTQ